MHAKRAIQEWNRTLLSFKKSLSGFVSFYNDRMNHIPKDLRKGSNINTI
jgi:hypothetical protein